MNSNREGPGGVRRKAQRKGEAHSSGQTQSRFHSNPSITSFICAVHDSRLAFAKPSGLRIIRRIKERVSLAQKLRTPIPKHNRMQFTSLSP